MYHPFRRALLAAVLMSVSAHALTRDLPTAKPESVGMSSERLARMNKAVRAYVDAGRTPGVVTLIMRHGKVVHSDVYGKADLESGRASRADDLFRMYSMTKPITSVALLMLFEEGRFQLTDPLAKFFPAVADMKVFAGTTPQGGVLLDAQKRPITIQDVFRHSAGFSYGFVRRRSIACMAKPIFSARVLDDLMQKLPKLSLLYQPGDRWVYSVAHDVQAALVEKLSGQKFDDFVRMRIFAPLGMSDSYFKLGGSQKARQPAEYINGPDGKLAKNPSPCAELGRRGAGGFTHFHDQRTTRVCTDAPTEENWTVRVCCRP